MIKDVNNADVIAEVRKSFDDYNSALDSGDVEALNGFFWNSASTIRFGPTENLFGFEEIAAFRSGKWKGSGGSRRLEKVAIAALGPDFATTNALVRNTDGRVSRQSQTWARLPEGWRIVSAHVSQF
ncbi:AtzH-like domain-containing protein [Neorhizobium sp. LjRoot104]|uniref:AtzH-like domain-containing protein n=1 Tax=Neorhizobium sp. LjRoot104 TaxID=3342254 RepID=UPI003ECC285E